MGARFVFENETQREGTGSEPRSEEEVLLYRFILQLKALRQVKGFST